MEFIPTPDKIVPTRLQPGDLITVSVRGQISFLRQTPEGEKGTNIWIPMRILEGNGETFTDVWYLQLPQQRGKRIGHETALMYAQMFTSLVGLFVEDCYTLFIAGTQSHHQFPVTDCPPAPCPPGT